MKREALKFTDLDLFLTVMEEYGFGRQAEEIIFEEDKLPYCSAYLVPTELLPATFDLNQSARFGGSITHVQEITYSGNEKFYTDFMIYPLSLTGYVEVNGVSALTFAETPILDPESAPMIYVINLEDGGGQEFFLAADGSMCKLSLPGEQQPQEFKNYKLAAKKMEQLRDRYPATCQLYVLEQTEFNNRRKILQKPDTENSSEENASPDLM
ncbi:hypothetical protein GCM10023189_32670 [Nibrella saemangeumensis]|uniref:Uncharacterized protein n=1 Tax=Nibrella saemangeumensis TaxID=1084526 RepID=A0ABP8N4I8_9BACT